MKSHAKDLVRKYLRTLYPNKTYKESMQFLYSKYSVEGMCGHLGITGKTLYKWLDECQIPRKRCTYSK